MEGCPSQETQRPFQAPVQSQCLKDQQSARKIGAADIFIPECDSSGLYKEVQCYNYPPNGKMNCWCVDQITGRELHGTRVIGGKPNCEGIY